MNKEVLISLYSIKSAIITYYASMLFFLIATIYCIDVWFVLTTILIVMILFTYDVYFHNIIVLKGKTIVIQNVFKGEIIKDIDMFDNICDILFFSSNMKINFKDGEGYYFWGNTPRKLNELIEHYKDS